MVSYKIRFKWEVAAAETVQGPLQVGHSCGAAAQPRMSVRMLCASVPGQAVWNTARHTPWLELGKVYSAYIRCAIAPFAQAASTDWLRYGRCGKQ